MNEADEEKEEEARKITRVGSFYKDFDIIRKRKKVHEEVQRIRAKLEAKVREKERLQHEQEEKQRKELELQKLRQLEAWRKEQEWKTKHYFEYNQFHRKVGVAGDPTYSGDIETQAASWRPHGRGKFIMNNVTIIDGAYVHGEITEGKVLWKNFYQWEGMLWRNKIHGKGIMTRLRKKQVLLQTEQSDSEDSVGKKKSKYNFTRRYQQQQDRSENSSIASRSRKGNVDDDEEEEEDDEEEIDPKEFEPREAIANQGEVVCYRDELTEGLQIEFLEPIFNNYMTIDGHLPRVTLIKFVKNWKYLCRFHQETWPRERVIDFCRYNRFVILNHLPRILDIHSIGLTPDAQRVYDYRQQSFISKSIKQSSTLPQDDTRSHSDQQETQKNIIYQNRLPLVPGRPYEYKRRNIFESREVGIGQAQEEDDEEEKDRLKKLQWAKVLAERKAKFIEQKNQMYAQEQQKLLENAANSKRQAQQDEEKAVTQMTKVAVQAELQRLEDEYSAASTASLD